MPITMMCDANAEGAVLSDYWTNRDSSNPNHRPIYLRTTHVGVVLETREWNTRDDSDFYAVVWNAEKGEPERVEYASTRGWTYPNHAEADATPEVLAAHAAYQERLAKADRERRALSEAMTPTKGKRVRVVAGRKLPRGTEGEVFWYGEATTFGAAPRNGYKARAREDRRYLDRLLPPTAGVRDGYRVGLRLSDGSKVFTAATNVEVVP